MNIGNARLYHLESDLGLHGSQYQTAVSILFVTYIIFEVPSNLVLKKFTPSRWIGFITLAWGIIATLSGLVESYGALLACRLLLGAVEAGLFPGLNVYLTLFYTRRELAVRVGFLFVSAAIAGGVGGLLAYGIGFMDGVAGKHGWRVSGDGEQVKLQGAGLTMKVDSDYRRTSYGYPRRPRLLPAAQRPGDGLFSQSGREASRDIALGWRVWPHGERSGV